MLFLSALLSLGYFAARASPNIEEFASHDLEVRDLAKRQEMYGWTTCGTQSFSITQMKQMWVGAGTPTQLSLLGWYTSTLSEGTKLTASATICAGSGNQQSSSPCLLPVYKQNTFDFCRLPFAGCPAAANWFVKNMTLIIPGFVKESGVWGSVKFVITDQAGGTALCIQNSNILFQTCPGCD
ncbi:hypothetical protein BDR26DRAFT_865782 [Obelidium mucronatum]|nr:hypothetical protein BDR26DRAFT_865782 [Obelidium mucronatum]